MRGSYPKATGGVYVWGGFGVAGDATIRSTFSVRAASTVNFPRPFIFHSRVTDSASPSVRFQTLRPATTRSRRGR